MDKRKLKFRGGLHKNLIGSQISSKSGTSDTLSLHEAASATKSSLLSGKLLSTQSKLVEQIGILKLKQIVKQKNFQV